LEYVGECLQRANHDLDILDLCWQENPKFAIENFFKESSYDLVGITLRNTDDCAFSSSQSFLSEIKEISNQIQANTDGCIVFGGVGYSTMPILIHKMTSVKFGIRGEGEFAFLQFIRELENDREWSRVANLVWQSNGKWIKNKKETFDLAMLPIMKRNIFDSQKFFKFGGQMGIETKRGCDRSCIYCADPVAKGNTIRMRPPTQVGEELENLYSQGIDCFHTCDSEFNQPEWHSKEICNEIINRGLAGKIQWYAYCSPKPFTSDLARQMKKAGCCGINFGVDNGDETMLAKLGRSYKPSDIQHVVHVCHQNDIPVMLDLMFGAPGESRSSIQKTIELMDKSSPDRVGAAVGVRVYPNTNIASRIGKDISIDGLIQQDNPYAPVFYIEPSVSPFIFEWMTELTRDDDKYLFFNPEKAEQNYNYNDNSRLVEAIGKGYKGAYWDILRKFKGSVDNAGKNR
jgi:radical SAM superfamily enzyme YgiQ (UPF0313 family)